jgi:hypothetical protein
MRCLAYITAPHILSRGAPSMLRQRIYYAACPARIYYLVARPPRIYSGPSRILFRVLRRRGQCAPRPALELSRIYARGPAKPSTSYAACPAPGIPPRAPCQARPTCPAYTMPAHVTRPALQPAPGLRRASPHDTRLDNPAPGGRLTGCAGSQLCPCTRPRDHPRLPGEPPPGCASMPANREGW